MMKQPALSFASILGAAILAASCGEGSPTPVQSTPASSDPAPAPQSSQDPGILAASQSGPEAFVRALLSVYAEGGDTNRDNTGFYSVRTTALRAEAIAKNGYFDFDPILNAQDWDSLSVRDVTVAMTDADHAVATAIIRNFGQDERRQFSLVKESGGWRINDIASTEMPSLVARIQADLGRDRPAPTS